MIHKKYASTNMLFMAKSYEVTMAPPTAAEIRLFREQ